MRRSVGALCVAAFLHGCGGAGAPPEPSAPPSTAELEALYRARSDSALALYSDADAEFMTRMIGHHAQALEMSDLVPSRAASEEIRRLAARIITAQESEISLMRGWLEDRGRPAPDPRGTAPGAPGSSPTMAHDAHMAGSPGMLTPEQMRELEAATGASFDRLFLTYMIQHHRGAVQMVEELFATPGSALGASTYRIASGIQVDQRSEIARMQSLLAALGSPPPAR